MPEAPFEAALRTFTAERRYGNAVVARWQALAPADGEALLELARELRLGEHQLRDLWDWAEEIAARDRLSLARVLALEPVRLGRRARHVGRNDKLRLVKTALRRLRFPELAATEERLTAMVRALRLPRNVRVSFPEFLEGDELRVEIVADSVAALAAAAERIGAAAETATCKAIFRLLGEAP
ncbi:MAG: hypothetical protein U0587_00855 [Candidatus Binatia bacterium]